MLKVMHLFVYETRYTIAHNTHQSTEYPHHNSMKQKDSEVAKENKRGVAGTKLSSPSNASISTIALPLILILVCDILYFICHYMSDAVILLHVASQHDTPTSHMRPRNCAIQKQGLGVCLADGDLPHTAPFPEGTSQVCPRRKSSHGGASPLGKRARCTRAGKFLWGN